MKSDEKMEDILDRIKTKQYLHSKGLKTNEKEQFQLDFVFPAIKNRYDLRHIPNDYARSSLFTIKSKREPRKTLLREKLFHYNADIEILYTGAELRAEDDELIWLQILSYGQSVALGEPFEFNIKDLVLDVKWKKNGRNYDRARECISRLKATEILALNSKAYGKSGSISLIQNYTAVNCTKGKATQYRVSIQPNLIVLFAGNTFTSHTWNIYRELSPVARRLTDYIESHKCPFPLALEKFHKMCGSSNVKKTSWKQSIKNACSEILEAKIVIAAMLDKKDQICFIRE